MASNWRETTIGQFCPFAYGKSLPATVRNESGNIPVYGSGGINGYHDTSYVPQAGIIVGRKGTVGSVMYSDEPFWPIDTAFYITNNDLWDLKYTYYLLKTLGLEKLNSDSAVPGLNIHEAHAIKFKCPDLEERRRIAKIIDSFDSKIRLLKKTNQTLEQIAQALFKSWFVDFDPVIDNALAAGNDIPDALQQRAELRLQAQQIPEFTPVPDDIRALFPSAFEQSDELSIGIAGWIPKGWEKTSFESLIKLIGGGTPKTSVEEYWNGDIPWFSVVDAPNDSDVFVLDTEKHVTQLGVDNSSTKILRTGTTIISARGTVGKCALIGEPMAMNQSCYGINGNEGIADTFIYFLTRYQVSDLQKRGHGSVFNTITRETFKSINLAFSSGDLTQDFERLVRPYLDKILLNNMQVTELVKMREVLLPKLISGELIINKDVA